MPDDNSLPHPDDVLGYLLKNCVSLQELMLSWQHGIMSFGRCANQDSTTSMRLLKIDCISELPPPQDVAAFINKHMTANGYLCLSFIIPFPTHYADEIRSFVDSHNFHVEVAREAIA